MDRRVNQNQHSECERKRYYQTGRGSKPIGRNSCCLCVQSKIRCERTWYFRHHGYFIDAETHLQHDFRGSGSNQDGHTPFCGCHTGHRRFISRSWISDTDARQFRTRIETLRIGIFRCTHRFNLQINQPCDRKH